MRFEIYCDAGHADATVWEGDPEFAFAISGREVASRQVPCEACGDCVRAQAADLAEIVGRVSQAGVSRLSLSGLRVALGAL